MATRLIKGFQILDKVLYNNKIAFIYGKRTTDYFKIVTIKGNTIHNSVDCTKLKLLEKAKTFLTIKRSDISSPS